MTKRVEKVGIIASFVGTDFGAEMAVRRRKISLGKYNFCKTGRKPLTFNSYETVEKR